MPGTSIVLWFLIVSAVNGGFVEQIGPFKNETACANALSAIEKNQSASYYFYCVPNQ